MCNGGFSVRSARSSASSSSFLNCGSCSATQLFTNVATSTATEVSILTSSIASARAPHNAASQSPLASHSRRDGDAPIWQCSLSLDESHT